MKTLLITMAAACGLAAPALADLKVGSLHPLIGNLVRDIGGGHVEVIDLLKPGGDVHHFEPNARDIAALKGATLIFASGKHIEPYLDKLRESVGDGIKIVEAGKPVPSIKIEQGSELFMCCPAHAAGGIDPHWWHGIDGARRAARYIADELAEADPAGKDIYKAGAAAKDKQLAELKSWAAQQIALIPRSDRKLVTGHASFSYFCKEFGFKSIPLLGISREDAASVQYVTDAIRIIRENHIRAVFPEDQANPKVLQEIVRETGSRLGGQLIADGTAEGYTTYEKMVRHNVETIVNALKP